MNKKILDSVLAARGDTQRSISKLLGISLSRTNAKINEKNGAQFYQNEIRLIKEHYGLSAEQIESIFFN